MSRKKYIDRVDLELLNTYRANPKMTVAELGEAIDLTPGPTHTRLTKLYEEKFFTNIVDIDYRRLGFELYAVQYVCNTAPNELVDIEEMHKRILAFLSGNGDGFVARIMQQYDLHTKTHGFRTILLLRKDQYTDEDVLLSLQNKVDEELYPGYIRKGFFRLDQVYDANVELDRSHVIRHKPE